MTQSQLITFVPVIFMALVLFWVVVVYNGLVVLKNRVKNAWAQIDVQLKRRCDLIPNLIETVKGYAAHESATLENVVKARQQAINVGDNVKNRAEAENALSGTLKSLFAVAENYPDLKANENFRDLMAQLEGTENRISTERTRYNEAVKEYNLKVRRFPASIFASMFGFEKKVGFEAEEGAEKAPKVEF